MMGRLPWWGRSRGSRAERALEVTPAVLLLGLAFSVVVGLVAGSLGVERRHALALAIAVLMLGIRLSLRPARPPERPRDSQP